MAGISIYYKNVNSSCAGAPAAANIVEHTIGGTGADSFTWTAKGSPIFGFAVNVPVGATIRSFTGHVLLFDYPNSRYLWGRYVSADLHAGALPTVLGSIAMSTITPTSIKLIVDATPTNLYSDYDVLLETISQTETIAHSVIALQSEPLGFGVIWVANNNTGNHSATITVPAEQAMLWWG
jgi:hypothetical protein